MSNFALILPVVLQSSRLLDMLGRSLQSFRHKSLGAVFIICNRLTLVRIEALQQALAREVDAQVYAVFDKERSVAGAWNYGLSLAKCAGFNVFMISAIDVNPTHEAIDALLSFERSNPECDLWSSTASNGEYSDGGATTADECDFSCFMLRDRTIEKHGWFDKEFAPAYYEDNDYLVRLVLAGCNPKRVAASKHFHQVSSTIAHDAEVARRIRIAAPINRRRLLAKWGSESRCYDVIRKECFSSPFNSQRLLSWWPEQDFAGYSACGGLYE